MSSSALYQTLNVNKNVDDKELKSAYRKLAKKFHPDSNKDDPKAAEQFSKISNAYDILKDKEKRQQYDAGIIDDKGNQTGFGAGNPFGGRQPRGGAHPFGNAGFNGGGQGGFDDIFSDLFGGGMGGQPRPQKGQDAQLRVTLSFEDAALGTSTRVRNGSGSVLM